MQSLFRLFQPKISKARLFSTTLTVAQKPVYFTPRAINSDIIALSRKCGAVSRDPIWLLVNRLLRLKKEDALARALEKCEVPTEEFEKWRQVVRAYDFDNAMGLLRVKGFALTPAGQPSRHLPLWLVIHLLSTKMRTASQARLAFPLAVSHMSVTPMHLQAPILLLVAYALGQHDLPALMNPLVERFLETPMDPRARSLYCNHLLQAISRLDSSSESSRLAVTVLDAMSVRKITLWLRTYEYLLAHRFVSLDVAKLLRDRMDRDGVKPTRALLHSFLRVFSRAGMTEEAGIYLDAIREMILQKKLSIVPYGRYPATEGDREPVESVTHYNTTYLGSFHEERSVKEYLVRLASLEKLKKGHRENVSSLATPRLRRIAMVRKQRFDIADWTTALAIAVRNPRTDLNKLWHFWSRPDTQSPPHLRPTTATFTVLLKAFHDRKDYAAASEVWSEMRRRNMPLDPKALTVVVQVLTMSGNAHEAFQLMDSRAAKPALLETKGLITLDIGVINALMGAVIRLRRPDIAFMLWHHMEFLYGLKPDEETLNKLLEAAYLGCKLDDSLAGFIANLKLKNPFHRSQEIPLPHPPRKRREAIVARIQELIKTSTGARGLWNGEPAWEAARRIFEQVILGNWPRLNEIRPPAHPVRESADALIESPVMDLARNIIRARRERRQQNAAELPAVPVDKPPTIEEKAETVSMFAPYPQIVPNDTTFRAFIILCGSHGKAGDVPLALAWMRALDIKPRRQTLALALAYWGEVSMHAPLVERMTGQDEYRKLCIWMEDWVGAAGMPRRRDNMDALRTLAEMREYRS
ncbi:hypothetical protein OE88DRAFT_1684953 [Heliocybe sulcata]|uniref:Pentacotripeptide-repeat region of PRORP domain-containing protein n=1 Tax=Heliocybe sulcata TaxID=5364 RepID=A0A5C3MUY0_9AGAM|nr:hypothetical protein OE88DRAFT_1684953 [Heliocybe sulcata]